MGITQTTGPGGRWPAATPRVLLDGRGEVTDLVGAHLRRFGVRTLQGAWVAEAAAVDIEVGDPRAFLNAVVLIGRGSADPARARPWWVGGIPHLPVRVGVHRVRVGPLVVPGRSSCLTCHDLARAQRARGRPVRSPDGAAWTGLVAPVDSGPEPSLVILASAVTAAVILDVIAGDTSLAGVSTEVHTPVPALIHRHWPRHPGCTCSREGPERTSA